MKSKEQRVDELLVRRRIQLTLIATCAILFSGSFLIYINYASVQKQKVELAQLQVQLDTVSKEEKALQEELNRLSNPEYAKQVATNKYAMTNPEEGVYIFVLPPSTK